MRRPARPSTVAGAGRAGDGHGDRPVGPARRGRRAAPRAPRGPRVADAAGRRAGRAVRSAAPERPTPTAARPGRPRSSTRTSGPVASTSSARAHGSRRRRRTAPWCPGASRAGGSRSTSHSAASVVPRAASRRARRAGRPRRTRRPARPRRPAPRARAGRGAAPAAAGRRRRGRRSRARTRRTRPATACRCGPRRPRRGSRPVRRGDVVEVGAVVAHRDLDLVRAGCGSGPVRPQAAAVARSRPARARPRAGPRGRSPSRGEQSTVRAAGTTSVTSRHGPAAGRDGRAQRGVEGEHGVEVGDLDEQALVADRQHVDGSPRAAGRHGAGSTNGVMVDARPPRAGARTARASSTAPGVSPCTQTELRAAARPSVPSTADTRPRATSARPARRPPPGRAAARPAASAGTSVPSAV